MSLSGQASALTNPRWRLRLASKSKTLIDELRSGDFEEEKLSWEERKTKVLQLQIGNWINNIFIRGNKGGLQHQQQQQQQRQQHLMQMQPIMASYNPSNVTTDHIQQCEVVEEEKEGEEEDGDEEDDRPKLNESF